MSDSSRPAHGKRHGSSWSSKLFRKHDQKYHTTVSEREVEPLLAAEHTDVEDQTHLRLENRGRFARLRDDARSVWTTILVFFQSCARIATRASQRISSAVRRHLIAVLVFLLLLAAVIGLYVVWVMHHKTPVEQPFCRSEDCSDAGSRIYKNLAPNYAEIDPCTDFAQFACGGFKENHKLRPDQSSVGTLGLMAEENQQTLRRVLEKNASDVQSKDRANFQKLKDDYDACMDEKTIKSRGLTPLRTLTEKVKAAYHGETWLHSVRRTESQHPIRPASKDLTDVVVYLSTIGVESLLQLYVGADDKKPDEEVIFAGPPGRIGLPSKEYYRNEALVAKYQDMMQEVLPNFVAAKPNETFALALGSQHQHISASEIISGVISLERKLAEARPDEEDLEDVLRAYNPKTASELQKLIPQVSFDKIIHQLAPSGYKAEYVIVSSPPYMQNMSEIVDSTPKAILQAYLVWRTVQAYASRVEDPILEPLRRFSNELEGKDPDAREERWRTCIRSCDNTLGWTLSKFFVDEAFSPESKKFGDQIIDDIKDSFVGLLRDAGWMEQKVRDVAEKKVAAIDKKIGYPVSNPDILDAKALSQYYASLKISDKKHFENGLHAAQFEVDLDWAKLGKPTRHDEWGMSAPTVNAYYNPPGNEIVFPAGIMQAPVFYGPDVPQYLTYGAFAAVAGHELSHSFDNNGAEYDEAGRLRNWWTKKTKAAFDNKTSCFVEQYGDYTIDGPDNQKIHVNGRLTLGENVADAGGLHAAFKSWDKRGRPGRLLPILANFTKEQTFFLSYANAWCGYSTPEAAAQRIYRDPHSPPQIRILGTTSNSAAFREAFNCPAKKPTCELW